MTQLDIHDFKTGSVISTITAPEAISQYTDSVEYLDFISNYLYKTKKKSFVKTASTKTIGFIKGTTKKPYKQKGTGNARQGSLRSPQFRGGAIIFGPVPVTAHCKINKKEVQLAKKILLSQLIHNSLLTVVDNMKEVSKTKDFISYKEALLPDATKVLFVANTGIHASDVYAAGRNIKGVEFDLGLHFNVYKVSKSEKVVITKDALTELFANLFN